jgi:PAS domain S-box-containing protein
VEFTPGPSGSLSDAFEHASCGLITAATDGTITRVNATFCRWLGLEASDLVNRRRVQDLLTMGGKVFHQTHWAPLLQMQGSVAEVKLEFRHRDGHKVPMLINASRRTLENGQIDDLACMVVHDRHKYERELLRARRQAEDALEAKSRAEHALLLANRHKDEFLATLAHELRNSLAPVHAAVRLLATKTVSAQQAEWSRGVLDRQVMQLGRLVDDLLDISRVAEGKLELRLERVNIAEAIHGAIEAASELIGAKSHQLTTKLPNSSVYVEADPTRLTQIILNLLNNAAKYTPAGGRIEVEAWLDDGEVAVTVRDSGIGIASESLSTVFSMFSQLPSAHSHAQGGLGIGLSLVRALTEQQGGKVTAASAGLGLGSEFTIFLPLAPVQTNEQDGEELPPPTDRKQRRVLIVDDSEDAAVSLSMLLETDGHVTATVSSGQAALRSASDFAADVLLIDIGLPDISGYEVARKLRLASPSETLLLIALTGWSQEADRQAAFDAGFDHHLAKPVDYDRLLALLA